MYMHFHLILYFFEIGISDGPPLEMYKWRAIVHEKKPIN